MRIVDIVKDFLCDKERRVIFEKGEHVEYTPHGKTGLIDKTLEKDVRVRITDVYEVGDNYSFALMLEFYIDNEPHLIMISDASELKMD